MTLAELDMGPVLLKSLFKIQGETYMLAHKNSAGFAQESV